MDEKKDGTVIKQANFRISQEAADAFRRYCEKEGYNQAQGFDHIIEVLELNTAKSTMPGRTIEIESFEKSMKDIMSAYLQSLEINANAEARIQENFISALTSKDKTISDLQGKVADLEDKKAVVEQTATASAQAAAQAIKDAEMAEKQAETATKRAETAEKLIDERDKTIATQANEIAAIKEKAAGYDDLNRKAEKAEETIDSLQTEIVNIKAKATDDLSSAKAKAATDLAKAADDHKAEVDAINKDHKAEVDLLTKDYETKIRELTADMEKKVSDAKKDAALAQEKAVTEAEKKVREEYQDKLRAADKETALLQAKLEMMQERLAELTKPVKA